MHQIYIGSLSQMMQYYSYSHYAFQAIRTVDRYGMYLIISNVFITQEIYQK